MVHPMRARSLLGLAGLTLILSGCIVKTAADVVTAPVRVGSKAVDLATTSQSEADEARGREIRQREDCEDGNRRACREAEETYAEIQELLPTIPVEPDD